MLFMALVLEQWLGVLVVNDKIMKDLSCFIGNGCKC